MEGVEKICETFSLAELQELNKKMTEKSAKETLFAALKVDEIKIKADLEEINQTQNKHVPKPEVAIKNVKKNDLWCNENVQLLIKAVNLFPAGTSQRWDVIATARDVLNKAKALQNSDFSKNSLKTQANSGAFESFERSKKEVFTTSDITFNTEVSANAATNSDSKENHTNGTNNDDKSALNNTTTNPIKSSAKAWTKEEQALLEQAIKTYPISTTDRWERIAECIPNRSKKDCLRRVKELVELVNSKKEAQQAVK